MRQSFLEALVSMSDALAASKAHGNTEWIERWQVRLAALECLLPSGSGIDSGTSIEAVHESRIKLKCSYHHMSDQGSYDGWTEHVIRVVATFTGPKITISGQDRNEIKDYLHDVYHSCLTSEIEWSETSQRWSVISV